MPAIRKTVSGFKDKVVFLRQTNIKIMVKNCERERKETKQTKNTESI